MFFEAHADPTSSSILQFKWEVFYRQNTDWRLFWTSRMTGNTFVTEIIHQKCVRENYSCAAWTQIKVAIIFKLLDKVASVRCSFKPQYLMPVRMGVTNSTRSEMLRIIGLRRKLYKQKHLSTGLSKV